MKNFIAANPGFLTFLPWAKSDQWTESYAEEPYNSLNSFLFVDESGAKHPVRWSLIPAAQPVSISPGELAKRGPDYLEQEITQRVAAGPQHWNLMVTVANPGDPTADPNKAWPADRRTINVGTMTVQQIEQAIAKIEENLANLEGSFANPRVAANPQAMKELRAKYDHGKKDLAEHMAAWEVKGEGAK